MAKIGLREMIYYVFPEVGPWGGIKKGFHWVEHLSKVTQAAAVTPGGARPEWFKFDCSVIAREDMRPTQDDVVIFSWYADAKFVFPMPCIRKIFHVQDIWAETINMISHPGLEIITSGLFLLGVCNRCNRAAKYIPYGIRDFFYRNAEQKEPGTVAVMPRKNKEFLKTVQEALPASSRLVVIDNMCEEEVAEVLKRTDVFVPISTKESIGLPPLEAMCAGAVVCGFPGAGGESMYHGETAHVVANDDMGMLVKSLKDLLSEQSKGYRNRLRNSASKFMKNYTMELERERLIRAIVPSFL